MTNLLKISPVFRKLEVVPKGTSQELLWSDNCPTEIIETQDYPYFNGVGSVLSEIKEDDMKKDFTGFWIRTSGSMSLSDDSYTFFFSKEKQEFCILWQSESKSGSSNGIQTEYFYNDFNEALETFKQKVKNQGKLLGVK